MVLADGGTVHLRPIVPQDRDALLALHGRLSERTLYLRFFGPYPKIPDRDLHRFVTVDHHDRVALVATLGDDMIAVGRYERVADGSAEVAFIVQDDQQGRGLGSILLEHLAAAALEHGIHRFVAEVLAENGQMVRVFRDAGYQVRREFDGGILHLEFDIDPTRRSLEVAQAREQAAEARSVRNVLHARSIAVIGASSDESKVGHAVLRNLLHANFAGPVYPVNPDARAVRGVRAYPSVAAIPDEVDLAVVAVPAASVAEVADECLAKGVKALLVITSGFADAGEPGAGAQHRLAAEARAHGMRLIGPSALGVVNNSPQVRMNASLAPVLPGRGRVGFFSQSGALGIAILAEAAQRGLGLSTFVSAGNRADLSGNDLLQYWQTDPDTDVVLLYLESFGNPRKFARLARRLTRSKPVVAVKSGRHGRAGSGVAAVDEASVAALFEQAGVIRVESLAQLFDAALLLANQPLPAGPRVAVVGNSSALGLLVADAVLANGLQLASGPVDVGAAASPEDFAAAVRAAAELPEVDALVVVFVPLVQVHGTRYATALRSAVAGLVKPVVSTFLATEGIPAELSVPGADGTPGPGSVPSYPSPERAVLALARAVRYAQWRRLPLGEFATPAGLTHGAARELVAAVLAEHPQGRTLTDAETDQLLAAVGVHPDRSHRRAGGPRQPDPVSTGGVSCAFELVEDPSFGALLSFGLGGVVGDLLGDRAYRAVPLSDVDAAALVRAPRAAPLLTGYQGSVAVDLDALTDLALRLSRLIEQVPQLSQLSLSPVLASPAGVAVTGATAAVAPVPQPGLVARLDEGPRRLS